MNESNTKHKARPALDALTDEKKAELIEGAKVAHAAPPSEFRTEFDEHAERCFARHQAAAN